MTLNEILELTFNSFWSFCGMMIILAMGLALVAVAVGALLGLIFRCWNRALRSFNIRKHGWPPPHCDADGDFPKSDDR